MNDIPKNLKAAMEAYAKVHADYANDGALKQAQLEYDIALEAAQRILKSVDPIRESYDLEIAKLEDYIKAQVMELGHSVLHSGVKASHRSGYERITWDNQYMTKILMDNPALLPTFKPARKVTEVKPSVTVTLSDSIAYTREDAEADVEKREELPF